MIHPSYTELIEAINANSEDDMHCDHCVRAVTEAINKIDGASAKVNLKKKEAVVSYEKVVEDAAIREAVEKAGYTVQSIQG